MSDDFGDRVGTALREQSPEHLPHLTLDDVAPVARLIRARRRAALGAAALGVVLAAALPFGLNLATGGDRTAPPTKNEATLTPGATVVLSADTPLDPSRSGEWITPDNDPLEIDAPWARGPVQAFRLGERRLVISADDMTARLVGPSREVEWSSPFVQAVADPFGQTAAVITTQGDLVVVSEEGKRRTFATQLPDTVRLGAVNATSECVATGLTHHCWVALSDEFDLRTPWLINVDGSTREVTDAPGAVVVDAGGAPSLLTVRTQADENLEACSTVLDVYSSQDGLGDTALWTSCTLGVHTFAPDGKHVAVVDAYQSGDGPTRLGIADADTGEVAFWLEPDGGGFIAQVRWLSGSALEVSNYSNDDQTWRLHQVSTDGTVRSQMARPVQGNNMPSPFVPVLP